MIPLHHHSTFSFLDGYGTPKQVAERAKELGFSACALTDHGNTFAHVPWQKEAKKAGIKPIFGCEFYVVDDISERTKVQESLGASAFPHVTILASDQAGYRNLLTLHRLAWENMYYKPRVDWDAIARHQDGLVVLSGCLGGYPTRLLRARGPEEAAAFLARMRERIQQFFVELIPEPGIEASHEAMPWLVHLAHHLKIPMVLTPDAHFPRPEDHDVQDLMVAVGCGKRIADTDRLALPAYQYCCTEEELIQRALEVAPQVDRAWFELAARNTEVIAERCSVEIPRAIPVRYPGVTLASADEELWSWVQRGFRERGIDWRERPEYLERAQREFSMIQRKGFCDYLLVIADVVRWMKDNDRLVILRGSAAGCLLLFLLGASEVDPIVHGLSFERFYDDSRPDPPDVDIDFERGERPKAIQYIYDTYGAANCSQIAALSQLKAKAALLDAAKAFGIPRHEVSPLSAALESADEDVDRQLAEVTEPSALAVLQKYPQLRIMQRMIGQYRQSSTHAAGVLVSSAPLGDVVGVVLDANKRPVACVDKKGAQELGFLKIDCLSVNALDIVAKAVRILGKPMSWLYSLSLDDERAIAAADAGLLAGVFQLDGASAARVAREIRVDGFRDIVAASALCRPGPGDWVPIYTRNKRDRQSFDAYLASMHPVAAAVVSETNGILLYQEQVMRLARELAGFEWKDVHKLRKDVADKVGLDPQRGDAWRSEWSEKFVGGCEQNGVARQEAEFWWGSIQTHGGYSFNKSHCTSYGIVGYWMLYLKAHHPMALYAAYMSLEDDEITLKRLIAEFKTLGGEVRLLDPTHSRETFATIPGRNAIVGGYCNIKGIGPKTAEKLLSMAPGGYPSWGALMAAMPAGMRSKIEATGVLTGEWNVQELIAHAPWFPVPTTSPSEAAYRAEHSLMPLGDLPSEQMDTDVVVAGYVTATSFDTDRVALVVEDESRSILVRVAKRHVHGAMAAKFRALLVSDYVAVQGWWAGSGSLFAKDVVIISRRAEKAKPVSRAKAKEKEKEKK